MKDKELRETVKRLEKELQGVSKELIDSDKQRVRAASVIVNLQHENSCLKQERDAWQRCAEELARDFEITLKYYNLPTDKALSTYNELKKGNQ